MGFWKKTGKVLGHAVDLRVDRWMDVKELKRSASYFWREGKRLFEATKEKNKNSETFDEAVNRLNLTQEALELQKKRYQYFFIFFIAMAAALFIYTAVIIKMGNWRGACISSALAIYALSHAFRFHFWCFQIRQRKLGCNGREWLAHIIPFIKLSKRTKLQ